MPSRPSQVLRASTLCALCLSASSTPVGEHVLPRALMKNCFLNPRGLRDRADRGVSVTQDRHEPR